ncbi:hypothetical protein GCM10023116_23590 [Kistimonas scapharcae]|uniref:Transposase n=1 Tax=Kistimonas scapharcae TaxID=1036133 RepID=A0ABP8V478_9GAMM
MSGARQDEVVRGQNRPYPILYRDGLTRIPESFNRLIRKTTQQWKTFPNDKFVMTVFYRGIAKAPESWRHACP